MVMSLYKVYAGYRGYDVNAYVKAESKEAAEAALVKHIEFVVTARLVEDGDEIDDADLAEMEKAENGAVLVYDEGT